MALSKKAPFNKAIANKAIANKKSVKTKAELPPGFALLGGGERVSGWYLVQADNVLVGTMEGAFDVRSRYSETGKKRVYRIRATRPGTLVVTPEGDEVTAEVGDTIGLDEKGYLKSLATVENGVEVYVMCVGKMDPTNEAPMGTWEFVVAAHTGEV